MTTPLALEKARAWLDAHWPSSANDDSLAALLDEARAEGVREGLEKAAAYFDQPFHCECGRPSTPACSIWRCEEAGRACDGAVYGPPISKNIRKLADEGTK